MYDVLVEAKITWMSLSVADAYIRDRWGKFVLSNVRKVAGRSSSNYSDYEGYNISNDFSKLRCFGQKAEHALLGGHPQICTATHPWYYLRQNC